MIGYLLLRLNAWVVRWLQNKVLTKWSQQLSSQSVSRWVISIAISGGLVLIYLAVLFGVGYGLSQLDPRMKDLFTFSLAQQNALLEYAHRLNFDTRLVYWQAAWNTFNDYPWLGVGLGNVGFFFPEKLGSFAWKLVEVRNLIYRSSVLLNSKSLWLRLLAETGLVGFSIFTAWLASLWAASESRDKAKLTCVRMLSLFGRFVLLALLIEGFSVDSFALPYIWVALGLATAACHLNKTENS
jgi:O-antigen ligase